MVSSPCVHIDVQRPSRAMSPRMTVASSVSCQSVYGGVAHTVHEYSLRDIVSIVTGDYMVNVQHRSTSIQGLTSEYATERAVVLLPDLGDNGVHSPAVELVVAEDLQRQVVLHLVALHGLDAGEPGFGPDECVPRASRPGSR